MDLDNLKSFDLVMQMQKALRQGQLCQTAQFTKS